MKYLRRITTLAITALLIAAPAALGAGNGGQQIGQNLGDLFGGWARTLFLGIAGLVAVKYLFARRMAELAVFVGIAVVIGGFALAPGSVQSTITSIWRSVAP